MFLAALLWVLPSRAQTSLDEAYHIIASKTFVDLTHAFGPDSAVWSGFGQARMSPAIDPKTRKPYTIEKDGFRATELKKSDGDYHIAFRNYEQLFHPLITRKQRAAERFSGSFAPKTRFGIFVRNQVIHLMFMPFVANLAMGRLLFDPLTLPV